MRLHPALLALGLIVAAGLACNFSVGNVNNGNVAATNTNADNTGVASNSGNASASNTSGEAGGVRVEELHVAKDKDGDEVKTFSPSDRTVYAVATLSELKAGTKVKFTWYAADVEGQTKDTKVQDIEYTTGSLENKVSAHLTLPKDWPKGKYRVETEINGRPDKSVEYTVE